MTCKVGDTCTYSSYTLVVAAGSAGSGSDFEELGAGAAAHPSSCTLHWCLSFKWRSNNGFTIRGCVGNRKIVVSFDAAASHGEFIQYISSWGLFVVVLARGKQGITDPVTCFRRTNNETISCVTYHSLDSIEWCSHACNQSAHTARCH